MNGVLAAFASEAALRQALDGLRAAHITRIDTYTPVALDEPRAGGGSPVPAIMFAAGLLGFAGCFALMWYADTVSYPIDVGGRPRFAWPAYVPIAFEIGVLAAIVSGFVGFLVAGRLLRLHDPVDECPGLAAASRDGWLVSVREPDAARGARARAVLRGFAPLSIETIP